MNTNQSNGKAWSITIFFTLFMSVMTLNLILFPACAADSMATYGIGQAELTTLSSVTSVVGVFAGIFFGRMLDTKDVKKNIALYMAIGTALFFARAMVENYTLVLALTFLASLSVGICQIAGPKVIGTWFPPEKVGPAMTVSSAGAGIGSAAAFALGALLGLHGMLLLVGGAYLVLTIVWIVIGAEGPYKVQISAEDAEAASKLAAQGASRVYKSKSLWMLIFAFSLAVTSSMLVNTYMINSFVSKGLESAQASAMGTFLNLALMLGGFVMAPILASVKRFNPLLAICMLGSAVLILAGWFLPLGTITWVCVILGGVVFGGSLGLCAGRIPLMPMTGEFGPENIGTASGFTETLKGVISFLLPIIVANILGTNYNGIYIVFAVCGVLCVVCGCIMIPELGEKGKLFQESQNK